MQAAGDHALKIALAVKCTAVSNLIFPGWTEIEIYLLSSSKHFLSFLQSPPKSPGKNNHPTRILGRRPSRTSFFYSAETRFALIDTILYLISSFSYFFIHSCKPWLYLGQDLEGDMGKILASTPADSDRTISVEFVRNQAEDAGLEAESAMVVPVVDSASRNKAVVESKSIQLPLEPWLKKIDSGRGIWTATKTFRSDGKKSDKVRIFIF
jgi:hypothetical protein